MADAFAAALSRGAERPFVVHGARVLTYGDAWRDVTSLAAALADMGVVAGDRVGLLMPNRPEAVVGLLAAAHLGAAAVPLNPGLTTLELTHQLRQSGATALITVPSADGRDLVEWFEDLVADAPDLHAIIVVDGEDLWFEERIIGWRDALAAGAHRAVPDGPRDAEAALAVLYTSGTTGKPKGVVLSHRALVGNARATGAVLGLAPEDVALLAVPHATVFGTSVTAGAADAGASLVLQDRFTAAEAVQLMADHRVTLCHGVPTMFALLLADRGFTRARLPALRTGIIAAAPVAPDLVRRVRAVCDVEIAYGLTETGPTVSITRPGDGDEARATTVGRLLEGVEARLAAPDGELELADGVGELAVRGPGLMSGYDRMPAETRRAFGPDGFLRTGDLATIGPDGLVRIVGRRKEIIIRGGYNVVPREVEDVLRAHPAVGEVCVVGVPHDVLGERICACVVPVEGAMPREDELIVFARERMADYKVPDLVRFLEALPLTASGKVWRRELVRSLALEHSTS